MTEGEDLLLMMRVKEIIWHVFGYLDLSYLILY